MITRITTYGLPSDSFTRIVEERELRGDVLHVSTTTWVRPELKQIQLTCTIALPEPTK